MIVMMAVKIKLFIDQSMERRKSHGCCLIVWHFFLFFYGFSLSTIAHIHTHTHTHTSILARFFTFLTKPGFVLWMTLLFSLNLFLFVFLCSKSEYQTSNGPLVFCRSKEHCIFSCLAEMGFGLYENLFLPLSCDIMIV